MTLMIRLLIIIITQHTPQNRMSDNTMHATLNTINGVDDLGNDM
jgi:hypothetical protein